MSRIDPQKPKFIYFQTSEAPRLEAGALEGLKNKKETGEKEPLEVDQLVARTNTYLNHYAAQINALPKSLQRSLHDNIVQYFLTSADRYDKDLEKGLDRVEFARYREDMLQELRSIVQKYALPPEARGAREKQREGAQHARETVKKAEEINIKRTQFNVAGLWTPEGIQQELGRVNASGLEFQEEATDLSQAVSDFQRAFQQFEEGKSSWDVFLRGSPLIDDPETEALKNQLSGLRQTMIMKMAQLRAKKQAISNHGARVNEATDRLRATKVKERDQKLAETGEQGESLEAARKEKQKNYRALAGKQAVLVRQRDELKNYGGKLNEQLAAATETQAAVRLKKEQLETFNGHIDGALGQIEGALALDLPEEQRRQLEHQRDALLSHKTVAASGLNQSALAETETETTRTSLEQKLKTTDASSLQVDVHLREKVVPTLTTLTQSIQTLEFAKLKNATQRDQVENGYAQIIETLDQVDRQVSDNVIEINLTNEKLWTSLESQKRFIDTVEIERPDLWDATGGLMLNKVGEGFRLLTNDVLVGMLFDPSSEWLKQATRNIPIVKIMAQTMAFALDVTSGVLEGTGELVTGLTTMLNHPIATAQGLGTLIGRDPKTGEWAWSNAKQGWTEMGKAMIAYENFEKGEAGKGVGKVALNVILTATGMQAIGKAGQVGKLAYAAARTTSGVARSALRTTGAMANTFAVEFFGGLKSMPGNFLKSTGKAMEYLGTAARRLDTKAYAHLLRTMDHLNSELASARSGLAKAEIGGKTAAEIQGIAGKTAQELEMLKGADLAKMGIERPQALREFLNYKEGVKTAEAMEKTLAGLARTRDIILIAPELEAGLKLKGKRLEKFVGEFNEKYPEGYPDRSFLKLRESGEGVLAFNAEGKLQLFENDLAFQSYRARAQLTKHVEAGVAAQGEIATHAEAVPGGTEMEVKLRLRDIPLSLKDKPGYKIVQEYLDHQDPRVTAELKAIFPDLTDDMMNEARVRRKVSPEGKTECYLTVKGKGTLERMEREITISEAEYARLTGLVPLTGKVEKTRHVIALEGGLKLEVDVYGGKMEGLMTAEVEFTRGKHTQESVTRLAKQALPLSEIEDVTHLKSIKNKALSTSTLAEVEVNMAKESALIREGIEARPEIRTRLGHMRKGERLQRYEQAIDFVASPETQARINAIFDGLEALPEQARQRLREYIERNAIEQHFDNPEQYVSHGFDHSLNVKYHMETALRDNPDVVRTMALKYGLSETESHLMMRLVAVFHDFGYPEVERLGGLQKALHAFTGAEIAATDEFLAIMRDMIRSKGAPFDELMFDFKNAILYHSADKVEIFRDAKIKIAHGEFIIDADNIIEVYSYFRGKHVKGKIEIVSSAENEAKMKAMLAEGGYDINAFEFKRPETTEITAEGKFRGRKMDLKEKQDALLGVQFKETHLADDPMNYMIRLTDNCDMTVERFSALQRTDAFREIYYAFGPLDGQDPPTGHLLEALELWQKGDLDIETVLGSPKFKALLDRYGIEIADAELKRIAGLTGKEREGAIKMIVMEYKSKVIDAILKKPEHAEAVAKFDRLKEIGMKQNSEAIRHFGGCESVKDVKLCCGHHLTITVDEAKFRELNQTKVAEKALTHEGQRQDVFVGLGEYQIWRAYEAYRSLKSGGKNMTIIVMNQNGETIVDDFERTFSVTSKTPEVVPIKKAA